MTLGIMQPYLFPYLGYFQLIQAVDEFIFYDDVNYIKGGWINRNYILANGKTQLFTLNLEGASSNKKINEITIGNNSKKLLRSMNQAYSKSPFFSEVFPMIEEVFSNANKGVPISKIAEQSIKIVSEYLGIKTEFKLSSVDYGTTQKLNRESRIFEICKSSGSKQYINTIYGEDLYDKKDFKANGIELKFIQPSSFTYKQNIENFIPNLSIIDVLMNNSTDIIRNNLDNYTLV